MKEVTVTWGIDLFKADPNKVYREILEIGDEATPQQIVEKAKNKNTELHKCFTWNNSEAAEKYRLVEARTIARSLVIVPREDSSNPNIQLRALHKVDTSHSSGYKRTEIVIQNKDDYASMYKQAQVELAIIKKKYHTIVELQEIWDLIV